MMSSTEAVNLLGRIMVACYFLWAAWFNIKTKDHQLAELKRIRMPMRGAALVVGLMLQLGGSVLLLYANTVVIGGVMLIVFLIAADAMFHSFLDLPRPGRADHPQVLPLRTHRAHRWNLGVDRQPSMNVGGEAADRALEAVRDGGWAVHPNGVMPEPKAPPGVRLSSYDVVPGQEGTDKLNRLIEAAPFEVHVARTFPLDQVAEAHRALDDHYLGKLALSPRLMGRR